MRKYQVISPTILQQIIQIVGKENVLSAHKSLEKYAHDETEDLQFYPEVVAIPHSVEQISRLMQLANAHLIPITPRGGGTGLSGGALACYGGLVISMEQFNKILEIDEDNLQATAESGVITEVLMNAVAARGLLYPVDPSSKGTCFIGGNMAHGSGGPRVVKYSTIREYALNFEVVLPTGEVIWTGANTLKYASGYNLTQLFIGSEGTLGIITKVVIKLIPRPTHDLLLLASFATNEQACQAVSAIFKAGITPSALEFMERRGIEWVMQHDQIYFDLKIGAEAFLLIELDGNSLDVLLEESEKINNVLETHQCQNVLLADTVTQKEALWKIRRTMAVSVKAHSVYKEEDVVVPRAALPVLIRGIKNIGKKYGFESVCYGHAGDGNLHINIIKGSISDKDWNSKLKEGIKELFELTVKLGGTLSGEHGIGLVQKEYMPIKYSPIHLHLMRGIKQVFDPNYILNPGKIF